MSQPLDVLLSIFAEKKSYASVFLKTHNVNKEDLHDLVSAENIMSEESITTAGPEQKLRPNQADKILKSYCENLNQKYFDKKIDPVIGREDELRSAETDHGQKEQVQCVDSGRSGSG
jgi:ATP-dependent Clp protease ATP-binding subunit ClpA